LIVIARSIEAWRDAQIFKNPKKDRGFLWHILKYPQYGLWVLSGLIPFIGFYFWPGYETTLLYALARTAVVILFDTGLAHFAFEYFLKKFRAL